ncbi:MAG: GNAT family N-acetyltransferase [Polaromonas sp. 28-63-22]|nr:MAG: GNAT family N-acetyltransferase [Polaromonas sp. 28-63-22]
MPLIRPSRDEDLAAITAIYAHHVLHGTGSFETDAPSAADMAARRADVLSKGLPYLVAEHEGQVAGFAYGNWFKPRPAYRYSVNTGSVGIHQAFGFTQVGIVESCGWKLGAWRDIVIMQKTLGVGDSQPPHEPAA